MGGYSLLADLYPIGMCKERGSLQYASRLGRLYLKATNYFRNLFLRMSGPKKPHFAEHIFADGSNFPKFAELILRMLSIR